MIRARLAHTVIRHSRFESVRHVFGYRGYPGYSRLVDVDDLPMPPRLVRPFSGFAMGDRLGDPAAALRRNVDACLAEAGIALHGGRILTLGNAREHAKTLAVTCGWGLPCAMSAVNEAHRNDRPWTRRHYDAAA
ncbi:DUF1365 domain-containing protein [Nocardia aurantiaca]|uniref:Uncharacterized protein n=1 Tax=Nocardia aurantiaca TaxID=2675850 RepID=A0A6I3L2X9_9NOCA|nr:DUF1365 family protein [Nocardia aurantiaca]MTE15220.1 hypothetical protein [Nocardia aurantiaca]